MKKQELRPAPQPIEMRLFATDALPPVGSKFVAFYGDGSGASIYVRRKDGNFVSVQDSDLYREEDLYISYAHEFINSGFDFWALLPDDFELWEPQS